MKITIKFRGFIFFNDFITLDTDIKNYTFSDCFILNN
jgi:hypothetical protein